MDGMDPVCFNKSLLKMLPLISPLKIILWGKQGTHISLVCFCLHFYFISPLCCMIRITELKNTEKNYRPIDLQCTKPLHLWLVNGCKSPQMTKIWCRERALCIIKRMQRLTTNVKCQITGNGNAGGKFMYGMGRL